MKILLCGLFNICLVPFYCLWLYVHRMSGASKKIEIYLKSGQKFTVQCKVFTLKGKDEKGWSEAEWTTVGPSIQTLEPKQIEAVVVK